MKILDVNNICDALVQANVPGADVLIGNLEAAATTAAWALATHLKILNDPADYQAGFAGLCANFRPKRKGQKCPEVIDQGDEGGEWE